MIANTITATAATFDRKALSAALTIAAKIVERRNTIPVLSAVLLTIGSEGATIAATDLDILATIPLPCDHQAPGALAINLDAIKAPLAKMKGDRVRLADVGAGAVTLTDVQTGATLRITGTYKASDFPLNVARNAQAAPAIDLDASTLRTDLARLALSVSTEETRYYLNGMFAHLGRGADGFTDLRFASTDGHRLTRIVRPIPGALLAEGADIDGHPLARGVIIPRKTAKVLCDIIGKKGTGAARVRLSDTGVIVEASGVTLASKLIDGSFPDYSRVIPAHNSHRLTVSSDALSDAAAGATAHCGGKDARAVALTIGRGWLTASATSAENGRAAVVVRDGVEFDYRAPLGKGDPNAPFCIGANGAYLRTMATTFDGARVVLSLEDASAPILWECPAAPEIIAVLMPMRTDHGPLTPEGVARLNATPADKLEADAPALVASIKDAEPGAYRTERRRKLGALIRAAREHASQGDQRLTRLAMLYRVATWFGDQARADRAMREIEARGAELQRGGVAGAFASLGTSRAAPVEAAQAVPAVEAPEMPEPAPMASVDVPGAIQAPAVPEPDATSVEACDARVQAAEADALRALRALGVRGEPGRDPRTEAVWLAFCCTALGMAAGQWVFAQGKQRDRKARNRGLYVVTPEGYQALRDRFNDLGAWLEETAPAAETVEAPAAPVADLPKDSSAKDSDVEARLASLEHAVTQLRSDRDTYARLWDASKAPAGRRVRTDAERRAILRAWRLRAQLRQARATYDSLGAALRDETQARRTAEGERNQARMRLAMALDRRTGTATRIVRQRHALQQTRAALRIAETTRERVAQDAQGLRAELDRLAPIAAAITALAQPARPSLTVVPAQAA